MKKAKKVLHGLGIASICMIAILFPSCDYGIVDIKETEGNIKKSLERAYFEGQRDCYAGDKRIEWTKDSCWVWIKSPWNNGRQPIFDPSIIHSKNGN